ncbi:MAG: leucyl aminopeptidase [Acidimicrobiales bacterium]
MPIVVTASTTLESGVEALGVPVCVGFTSSPVNELDSAYCAARGFTGKAGEVLAAPGRGGTTAVAVGLGEPDRLDGEALRRAAAEFVRTAWRNRSGAFLLPDLPGGMTLAEAAKAVTEGACLAAYRFDRYKSEAKPCQLETLSVCALEADPAPLASAIAAGAAVARAVCLARDLVNDPAGSMTPRRLAEVVGQVAAERGLGVEVWDEERISSERLGGLMGVAAGSDEPARLIRLSYEPPGSQTPGSRAPGSQTPGAASPVPLVVLVGKGITFDSGGLSLKSAEGMMTMKTDMSGAAAVIGAMSALAELKAPVRVIGIMPTTENMPGGHATKPGDVLRTRNGKTIEVLNTDAEGRLVLADGLALAAELEPAAIIDLATLTGACVTALGRGIAGLMGNNEDLVDQVRAASERAGERVWPLPLPEDYRKHVESEIADIKNIGEAGQAGALVAGLILSEFVGESPWAHLDIAGPARSYQEDGYQHKGGTGFGVRTLIELLRTFEPVTAPV